MLGLVVNDTLFATIIGASFTACMGLMAWIVKTLLTLSIRVGGIDDRLSHLESQNGQQRARSPHLRTPDQ